MTCRARLAYSPPSSQHTGGHTQAAQRVSDAELIGLFLSDRTKNNDLFLEGDSLKVSICCSFCLFVFNSWANELKNSYLLWKKNPKILNKITNPDCSFQKSHQNINSTCLGIGLYMVSSLLVLLALCFFSPFYFLIFPLFSTIFHFPFIT